LRGSITGGHIGNWATFAGAGKLGPTSEGSRGAAAVAAGASWAVVHGFRPSSTPAPKSTASRPSRSPERSGQSPPASPTWNATANSTERSHSRCLTGCEYHLSLQPTCRYNCRRTWRRGSGPQSDASGALELRRPATGGARVRPSATLDIMTGSATTTEIPVKFRGHNKR